MPLLIPGYLYGVGRLLRRNATFGEAVALSLFLWSVIGWFSFGKFGEIVILLSATGTAVFVYDLVRNRHRLFNRAVLLFFAAILLRYLLTGLKPYAYGSDFIMHAYSTLTVLHHNGYGSTYYPFGLEGFGAFNIGFHFIAAGLSILGDIPARDSTVITAFVFWGVYFWAIYEWLGDERGAFIAVFSVIYPLTFFLWGGFPTLASISFSLLAFRRKPLDALPFWIGAFSTHFIPAVPAFLTYLILKAREWKELPYYVSFLVLLPQYMSILRYGVSLSPMEEEILNAYVLTIFPKALVILAFMSLLALLGYYGFKGVRSRVPVWGIALGVCLGFLSVALAYLDVPVNALKSMYLARMIVLLLPPAAFGVLFLWRRSRLTLLLPTALSLTVLATHIKRSFNGECWKVIAEYGNRREWFLTSGGLGNYLPIFGTPSWKTHVIITQIEEFRDFALAQTFEYAVCYRGGGTDYLKEVCEKGERHPDVIGTVAECPHMKIYRLKGVKPKKTAEGP